jgi:hypothetical protein
MFGLLPVCLASSHGKFRPDWPIVGADRGACLSLLVHPNPANRSCAILKKRP